MFIDGGGARGRSNISQRNQGKAGFQPAYSTNANPRRPGNAISNLSREIPPSGIASSKGYELRYFARKFGLSTAQAVALIREHGNNRAALNQAGAALARRGQA